MPIPPTLAAGATLAKLTGELIHGVLFGLGVPIFMFACSLAFILACTFAFAFAGLGDDVTIVFAFTFTFTFVFSVVAHVEAIATKAIRAK